jgi:superfamily II DNA helicase RecQ
VHIVQQKLRKYRKGKVVVYSNLVLKVKKLAEKLDYYAYYNRVVGKVSMLEAFAAGNKQVIVVTSALGIGVDIANI